MNESIYDYMKLGLIHFMAYPSTIQGEGPVLETIRRIAADCYFNAIEVSWIKDPAVRREAGRILDSARMAVAYGGRPRLLMTGLNINDLDEEGRRKALATLKEGIDEAYELKALGFAFLQRQIRECEEGGILRGARGIDEGTLPIRETEGAHECPPRGFRQRYRQEKPHGTGRPGEEIRLRDQR